MIVGDMAVLSNRLVKIVEIDGDTAWLKRVTDQGIEILTANLASLSSLRQAYEPRTMWAAITHLDLLEIEEEERRAKAEREAKKKTARKARKSNKAKRKDAA